jgi:hypothetical protein
VTRIASTCLLLGLLLLASTSHGITVVSDSMTRADGARSVHCWVHGWWTHIEGATWIWKEYQAQHPDQRETVTFTRRFWTPWAPSESHIKIAADNFYEVYMNDTLVATSNVYENFRVVHKYYIAEYLIPGYNRLKIVVTNGPIEGAVPPQNPAGLIYKIFIPEPLFA